MWGCTELGRGKVKPDSSSGAQAELFRVTLLTLARTGGGVGATPPEVFRR